MDIVQELILLLNDYKTELGLADDTIIEEGKYQDLNCCMINTYGGESQISGDLHGDSIQIWVQQELTRTTLENAPTVKIRQICQKIRSLIQQSITGAKDFKIVPVNIGQDNKYINTINFKTNIVSECFKIT